MLSRTASRSARFNFTAPAPSKMKDRGGARRADVLQRAQRIVGFLNFADRRHSAPCLMHDPVADHDDDGREAPAGDFGTPFVIDEIEEKVADPVAADLPM